MLRRFTVLLLLLCIVVQVAGCAGMKSRDKITRLEKSLQDYGAMLRWARYYDAHDFVFSPDGSKPGLDASRFEGFRIAAVNYIRSDLNLEETEATVYAEIQYYNDQQATIRTLQETQSWWYEPDSRRWFLDGELPHLK